MKKKEVDATRKRIKKLYFNIVRFTNFGFNEKAKESERVQRWMRERRELIALLESEGYYYE